MGNVTPPTWAPRLAVGRPAKLPAGGRRSAQSDHRHSETIGSFGSAESDVAYLVACAPPPAREAAGLGARHVQHGEPLGRGPQRHARARPGHEALETGIPVVTVPWVGAGWPTPPTPATSTSCASPVSKPSRPRPARCSTPPPTPSRGSARRVAREPGRRVPGPVGGYPDGTSHHSTERSPWPYR